MPNITSTGTYEAGKPGFEFLQYNGSAIGLSFSGSTLPTTLEVGFLNDVSAFVPLTNGEVTALPTTFIIDSVPKDGLLIKVTGGSPNFNVSYTGAAGPLG